MEEKLIEEIQSKIIKIKNESKSHIEYLTNEKEILEKELAANINKREIANGKLIETKESNTLKQDLEKINKELEKTINDSDKSIEELEKDQEHYIELENIKLDLEKKQKELGVSIEKLEQDKMQCNNEIEVLSKKRIIVNGKLQKTNELLSLETDLEKIEKEIQNLSEQKLKNNSELDDATKSIQEIFEKYNIEKDEKEVIDLKQEDSIKNDEKKTKNIFETSDIINSAKKDLENESKNYSNIHLGPNQIIQDNPIEGATRKNDKNVFETNGIINDVRKEMGLGTGNGVKPNFRITKEESNVEGVGKPIALTDEKDKNDEKKPSNKITYIEIQEADGNIFYKEENGKEDKISIAEALENKKSQFRRLDIKNICKEIAGGRLGALRLRRKVNPEIVSVLQHDPEQLKDYITSIYQKKELPFELTHNLDGIGILDKIKMNKFARSEEKLGARVIGKLFDRNKAIDNVKNSKMLNAAKEGLDKGVTVAKEKSVKLKDKAKDFVPKIPNKDNHIEEKANEAVKQSQEQTAKYVQEIMNQNDKEEVK